MTPANLQEWIQHPETLDRETLYELRNMLARYPYFQSLRMLYLKNLYILHDISFGAELKKAVLYIADRRQLFQLIEGERYVIQTRKKENSILNNLKEEPSVDRTLTLIDAFLSTTLDEATAQTSFDYSVDYTSYLMNDEVPTDETMDETPKLRGHSLIDDFIEKSENDSPLYLKSLKAVEDKTIDQTSTKVDLGEPISTVSTKESARQEVQEEEDDSCFTETLAKIYVKQQRYSKALEIIKKLSLKYPKKNAYFADQIRFLEKLIINANSK